MSNNKIDSVHSGGGAGLSTLLTVLFVGLKLGGLISWSWWWVLSPLWVTALLVVVTLLILIAVAGNKLIR